MRSFSKFIAKKDPAQKLIVFAFIIGALLILTYFGINYFSGNKQFLSSSYPGLYVYADSGIIYVTNGMNSTANDYNIAKLTYNGGASTLTFVSTTNIDNTFAKTTNAVIKSGLLYTMISGALNSFNLTSGAKISLGTYSGVAGQLFSFNGQVYFSSGQVGRKWF